MIVTMRTIPRIPRKCVCIAPVLFILLYFMISYVYQESDSHLWLRSSHADTSPTTLQLSESPPPPPPPDDPRRDPSDPAVPPPADTHPGVQPPPSRSLDNPPAAPPAPDPSCSPIPPEFPLTAPLFPCSWLATILHPRACRQRLRARLLCGKGAVKVVYEWVSLDTPPAAYSFQDQCLQKAVRSLCYRRGRGKGEEEGEEDLIPNLSHHVMFGGREMRNYTFLAVLSSVRFLQPCLVMVHADVLPVGPFWDTLVRLIPHLIHVQRAPPTVIFGHKVKVIEHSSDIARLEAVKKFGGVYQDTDYLLVNPVDDLRQHSVVMGKTIPNVNYCNCIFMGKPGAPFLHAWYDSYRTFKDSQWGFHSTIMPYKIHHQRPELPFHEVNTFVTPYFRNIKKLFYDRFLNWTRLHGIHLYPRFFPGYFQRRFDQQNSSLGQVTRRILFGDSQACFGGRPLSGEVVRMNVTGHLAP